MVRYMKVDLLYGRDGIAVNIPDDVRATVIHKHSMTPLPRTLEAVYVEPVPDLEEAVMASVAVHGDREIAVVPEGPYVIPLFASI